MATVHRTDSAPVPVPVAPATRCRFCDITLADDPARARHERNHHAPALIAWLATKLLPIDADALAAYEAQRIAELRRQWHALDAGEKGGAA